MIAELRHYYDRNGIGALKFSCRKFSACSGTGPTFTTAKESFVGADYERGTLPRLLFLSLDSGSAENDPSRKTMEAVRAHKMTEDVLALPKGRHWYETHELAWVLLQQFKPDLKLAEIGSYFAHVNSAKCCMNNPLRAQASDVLFENCREFIPGELRILKPDIIVTQGAHARRVVETFRMIRHVASRKGDGSDIAVIRCGDKDALWIATYHPTARGGLYQKEKANSRAYWRDVVGTYIATL